MVAKNARATSFGKTKEMDDFTASLDPTYKICDPATVNRIAQALEHVILEKLIAKHAELREQRGSPFTVRVLFSLLSCDRAMNASGVASMSEARARVPRATSYTFLIFPHLAPHLLLLLLLIRCLRCLDETLYMDIWSSGKAKESYACLMETLLLEQLVEDRDLHMRLIEAQLDECEGNRSCSRSRSRSHSRRRPCACAPARPFRVAFDPTRKFCRTGGFTNRHCGGSGVLVRTKKRTIRCITPPPPRAQ